ncbi:ClpP/crotonase-like domain-containing protein [Aspergillus granulosus]|uniref:ClpP/crotonase-like domain-containing protein n=1 Tax=Aspergillus granulosus TaxID=176169 RepID=A0ABR4HD48_9EURO
MVAIPKFRYISVSLGEEGVLVLKYNRPEAGNAINNATIKELFRALQWAVEEPKVRIIVQTGEGKFFTTGMDLSTTQGEVDSPQILYEVNKLMINCEKITIAAVNGPGVGYGASSIGLFDLVYTVPDAYFFTPFIKWGLCAEACSSFAFPSTMGRQRASHMLLTGDRIKAPELEAAGLVSKIIAKENFLRDVLAIAKLLAGQPAEALKANKQLLSKCWKEQLHETNERELRAFEDLMQGILQNDTHRFALNMELTNRKPVPTDQEGAFGTWPEEIPGTDHVEDSKEQANLADALTNTEKKRVMYIMTYVDFFHVYNLSQHECAPSTVTLQ